MGVDLSQYRSAIGSFGQQAGTPGPRAKYKPRMKMEDQDMRATMARMIIKKEAFAFWQTLFLITVPVMVIISYHIISYIFSRH